ncbi:hypothetical protein UCRNP2_2322 [Neofusicoccum parvum UCRNP2]|uniref:Uncharacterized protein n=1 Tax=Botryosphaeria parva (strain UCR-NP2) TaxID=1287680 RepID=R1GGW7_BOTPV|nr:hypothetical protein UCRNP2_2322 [Neofusicoccum parvum UCRNP2]
MPNALRLTVPDAPAAVAWQCLWSGKPLLLDRPDVLFSISVDSNAPAAALRLRVSVNLRTAARQKTLVYAFVPPDRLHAIEREPIMPDHIKKTLGPANIVGLRFRAERPVVLVAPASVPEGPPVPKNKAAGDVLSLLESLTQATELTVYMSARHGRKPVLDALYSSASAWAATWWPAAPSTADLRSMYQGRGVIILPANITVPTSGANAATPPSYDELALSAPSPPRPPPSKQRRGEDNGHTRQLVTDMLTREKGVLRDKIAKELLSDDAFYNRVLESRWERLRELIADEVRA